MSAVAHHDNITTWTYTDVDGIEPHGDGFSAHVTRKPRYVSEDLCIGAGSANTPARWSCLRVRGQHGSAARRVHPVRHGNPQTALIDIDACVYCGKCEKACPTNAIDFGQEPVAVTSSPLRGPRDRLRDHAA